MPTARRAPVVVQVRPEDSHKTSNMAPSTPPKAVRFPDHAEIVTGVTRPLTPTEAWSLYYFETHARSCKACHQPFQVVANGGRLCPEGHDLAYDVAMHVYHRDGQVYSFKREKSRDIRVEVPLGYDRLVALLKAMEHRARKPKLAPIINYENKYAPVSRAPAVQPIKEEEEPWSPTYVVPARTRAEKRSRHKPTRYSTIKVGGGHDHEYDRSHLLSKDEKRGSLYDDNKSRSRKEYVIEVLESAEERRRRRRKEYYD